MHIAILIQNGSDIPRALEVMSSRMNLLYLNWSRISKNGGILHRGVVDLALKNIHQPIFEGPPPLGEGLKQAPRIAQAFEGTLWDTETALPDLTAAEIAEDKQIDDTRRIKLEPEAQKVRETCIIRYATAQANANGRNAPDENDFAAARRLYSAGENIILPASAPLLFPDGQVTARDVLRSPGDFVGKMVADPRDWDDGFGRAKIYQQRDGGVTIHSYSHGETTYYLRWEFADVLAAVDQAVFGANGGILDAYINTVTNAIVSDGKKTILINHVAKLTGLNPVDIKKAEKKKEREKAGQRKPQNAGIGDPSQATSCWIPQTGPPVSQELPPG
jgi:hypothetical protein